MREHNVKTDIRLAAKSLGLVLWNNATGLAREANRTIRYGLAVGSADLIGILQPEGVFVAIETKSSTGRLRPEQRAFIELVQRCGGIACQARSVEDVQHAIALWRQTR